MSPALNGSSAIQRFEGGDAIEIRDGINFDFYKGLPHRSLCHDRTMCHDMRFISEIALHEKSRT